MDMRKIKGYIWFIRRFGVKRLVQWEKWRKEGIEIDYSKIFSPEQFKILEEHNLWPIK